MGDKLAESAPDFAPALEYAVSRGAYAAKLVTRIRFPHRQRLMSAPHYCFRNSLRQAASQRFGRYHPCARLQVRRRSRCGAVKGLRKDLGKTFVEQRNDDDGQAQATEPALNFHGSVGAEAARLAAGQNYRPKRTGGKIRQVATR